MLQSTYWSLSCRPQAVQKNPLKWETHAPQLKLRSHLPPTSVCSNGDPAQPKTNFKMMEVGHLDSHTRRNEAGAWSYTALIRFNLKPIKDLNVKNSGRNIHRRKPTKASQHRSLSWFFWSDKRSRYKQMGQCQTKKKTVLHGKESETESESHSVVSNSLRPPGVYTVWAILQDRIVEWVAFPFSRASSQPRNRSLVSHIAGRFFTSWATREAQEYWSG